MAEKSKFKEEAFIARWIAGELSVKESSEFNSWIKINPHEKKAFEELKNIWLNLDRLQLKKGLSKKARWEKINKAINFNANGKLKSQ